MALRESLSSRPAWASRRVIIAGAAAVALAAGGTATALAAHSAGHHSLAGKPAAAKARLASSICTGPAGSAYLALPGYQAFDAFDTSDCSLVQQYNVGDPIVPGTQIPGNDNEQDFNYSSTNEGVALSNGTLYFADTGNDTLAVVPTADLTVANYANPTETLVHVGINPQGVAVTPDGTQAWVADTGPQTGGPSLGGIDVVSTTTDTVTATLRLHSDPREIAFSPDGSTAYVTTGRGLLVIDTATLQVTALIRGLGDPQDVVVSPDGSTVYVTNTIQGEVDVISAATDTVTDAIQVGELPWQEVLSSDGSTLYVADGDSNEVSVISTATDTVTGSIPVTGDPVSVALTPDGSELWVGGLTTGLLTVFDTSNDSTVASFTVGYGGEANDGLGEEPTSIVFTTAPPPGG